MCYLCAKCIRLVNLLLKKNIRWIIWDKLTVDLIKYWFNNISNISVLALCRNSYILHKGRNDSSSDFWHLLDFNGNRIQQHRWGDFADDATTVSDSQSSWKRGLTVLFGVRVPETFPTFFPYVNETISVNTITTVSFKDE